MLTIEKRFIKQIREKVDTLSAQDGFGFVGLMRTSSDKMIFLSNNLQNFRNIEKVDCIKETFQFLEDVRIPLINYRFAEAISVLNPWILVKKEL